MAGAATTTRKPEDILSQLLQSGQNPNPNAQLDTKPWTPTYNGTPQEQAGNQVNLEYDAKLRAIREAAAKTSGEYARQTEEQKNYGNIIDPRLANIYGALGNSLTKNRDTTAQNYDQTLNKIRGYYDEAGQANTQTNTDLLGRITQSAQQLGIGAAVPDATGQLASDFQFNQGQLSSAKAGSSANLATLASQIFGLDTGRISAAGQEGAQARTDAQSQVQSIIAQLSRDAAGEQADYNNQLSGLEGDKATALRTAIDEITNQRNQDSTQARNNALQEMLSRSQLQQGNTGQQAQLAEALSGIQQNNRSFDETRRQFDQQMALQRQQLASSNANAAASRSSSNPMGSFNPNDPFDVLGLQLKGQQLELNNQKLNPSSKVQTKFSPGPIGLQEFFNSNQNYWSKNKAAGPKYQGAVQDILKRAEYRAGQARNQGQLGANKTDPYKVALSLANNREYPKMNVEALKAALQIYYKGKK